METGNIEYVNVELKEKVQIFCDPCITEGSQIFADGFCRTCSEYLCEECYKIHCKPKPMRRHVLIDAQTMPKSKFAVDECDESETKCLKHDKKPLTMYCKTHNSFCCSLCLSEEHESCNVSTIQECAKDVTESHEYRDFKSELETLQTLFKVEMGLGKTNVRYIVDTFAKLKVQEAVLHLSCLLDIVKDLEKNKDDSLKLLDSVSTRCEQSLLRLDKVLSDETSEVMKFMKMKQQDTITSQTKTCLENVKMNNKSARGKVPIYGIQKCQLLLKNVKSCLETQTELSVCTNQNCLEFNGEYSVSSTQGSALEIQSEKPKQVTNTFELISKFSIPVKHDDSSTVEDSDSENDTDDSDDSSIIESSSDSDAEDTSDSDDSSTSEASRITGTAVLSDGEVAFADFGNKMIKVMFPTYGHKIYALKLTANPFDVTEVRRGLLVVTLPAKRKCLVLMLSEDTIEKDYNFKTSRRCYGIASVDGYIYVAVKEPPQIEAIDMDGNVLHIFALDDMDQAIFASPRYVAVDTVRNRIYVTDAKNNTLTCLTKKGKVLRVYKSKGMREPYGIAVDGGSGLVFVCARSSDKLLCLDANFKLVSTLKDESMLRRAESVAVWNKQDRLYIGTYKGVNLTAMDFKKYY